MFTARYELNVFINGTEYVYCAVGTECFITGTEYVYCAARIECFYKWDSMFTARYELKVL